MTDTTAASAPLEAPKGLAFASQIKSVAGTHMPKSIAILGMYKTGKTTLAASASKIKRLVAAKKRVLILEAESGTASIAEDYPDVDLMPLTNFNGFRRAVDELLTKEHDYGVVVVDTMDKFVDYAVKAYVDGAADTRAGWGHLKEWTIETTWRAHKSDILFIFLFHEESEKDEVTGQRFTTFKLPGGAKKDLGQIYDIIARIDIRTGDDGEPHRFLQLGPAVGQITGSRYERKLPNAMVDPTLDKVYDLILSTTTTENN